MAAPSSPPLLLRAVTLLCLSPLSSSHSAYKAYLPNGLGVSINAYGHRDGSSPNNGNVNAFGTDFNNVGLRWTTSVCQLDSDGDGQSNGLELGDPCCVWLPGASPLQSSDISSPGQSYQRTSRNCSKVRCSNGIDPCSNTGTPSGGSRAASIAIAAAAVVAIAVAALA
jgi:hypothetical protein